MPSRPDILAAASAARATLEPALDRDWSGRAGELEWTCRRTLDHIVDALVLYSAHLATTATTRLPHLRDGNPNAGVDELLTAVAAAAAILAGVADAAHPGTRAFHPAGMADPSGFLAMGCDEILVHTHDIATGLGLAFEPPADLVDRVVGRLFPWAPPGEEPWAALLWANGRAALPSHERLEADWYWECAPLSEWDGTIRKRSVPPGW
jgi:hypothetical protein